MRNSLKNISLYQHCGKDGCQDFGWKRRTRNSSRGSRVLLWLFGVWTSRLLYEHSEMWGGEIKTLD
jgi:hypothetical protein